MAKNTINLPLKEMEDILKKNEQLFGFEKLILVLQDLNERFSFSWKKLGGITGVNYSYLYRLCKNERKNLSPKIFLDITSGLGIPIQHFFRHLEKDNIKRAE